MTIFEHLIKANTVINSRTKTSNIAYGKALKDLDYCVHLLKKGYSLDDDKGKLLGQYKHINKVPDAKTHIGKEITVIHMQNLYELVFPKVPHNHLAMILVQKFGQERINYISNGERTSVIKALRSMADRLESGEDWPMESSN